MSVEYGALVLLVAAVVATLALSGLPATVGEGINDAICRVFQDDCPPTGEATAAQGGQDGDEEKATDQPLGTQPRYHRAPQQDPEEDGPGLVSLDDDLRESDLIDPDGCRGPFGGDFCLSGDVTFSTQVSGIVVFLYEICNQDMACVRREAEAILDSLKERFPELDPDQLLEALQEDELPEKIEEVRDEGGCLNLRFEKHWGVGHTIMKWRHRSVGSGDDCFSGAVLHLADAEREANRKFEVTAWTGGVTVTLKVPTTDQLRAGYDLVGRNVPSLLEQIENFGLTPSGGIAGKLWEEATSSEHHDELAEAIEASRNGGSCLMVRVNPKDDGGLDVEWSTTPEGDNRC